MELFNKFDFEFVVVEIVSKKPFDFLCVRSLFTQYVVSDKYTLCGICADMCWCGATGVDTEREIGREITPPSHATPQRIESQTDTHIEHTQHRHITLTFHLWFCS